MVSKPFMGIWEEDSNVMHIFERVLNVCMPELYMKLYRAKVVLECDSVSEVINRLADAEVIIRMNGEMRQEFEDAARMDNGRAVAYGQKTKGLQHRTPDSVAQDQRFNFDEWEGEHRQTDFVPPTESEVGDD